MLEIAIERHCESSVAYRICATLSLRPSFNPQTLVMRLQKKDSIIGDRLGQPICERAQGQGQQRGGLKLGEIKKNTGNNHLYKTISQMNVNFLELISPTCTATLCCGCLGDRIQLNLDRNTVIESHSYRIFYKLLVIFNVNCNNYCYYIN